MAEPWAKSNASGRWCTQSSSATAYSAYPPLTVSVVNTRSPAWKTQMQMRRWPHRACRTGTFFMLLSLVCPQGEAATVSRQPRNGCYRVMAAFFPPFAFSFSTYITIISSSDLHCSDSFSKTFNHSSSICTRGVGQAGFTGVPPSPDVRLHRIHSTSMNTNQHLQRTIQHTQEFRRCSLLVKLSISNSDSGLKTKTSQQYKN